MMFDLQLSGGKTMTVSQEDADRIKNTIKGRLSDTVEVNGNFLRVSTIRGIFPSSTVNTGAQDDRWERQQTEWNDTCVKMSLLSSQEKTDKEMTIRILPAWKMSQLSESHTVLTEVYDVILKFFDEHSTYPRCPARVWWPIIKPFIHESKFISRYFQYVMKNDAAIEFWIKTKYSPDLQK